ncbi:type II toxin-antitoxin system VapC family toxin [Pseudolabrys taiwanensis]|uniref:type II toxin-antitoxin system VapC family toxin n=1 Tax=Pseudolabrys taiwanensis TaxID=331696 RepID=UPI0013B40831|nr:type II toxin-antitoxin system VapC family toxin [Pseudolabrys taiwanensis]
MIVIDTHVAIWLTTENPRLGIRSRTICEQALNDGELAISAISFWEMAMLTAKGRLGAATSPAQHRRVIIDGGAQELPVSGDIAILGAEIDGLPGDPADRLIAATAIHHNATLLTADRALLSWDNPLRRQDAAR